MNAYSKLATFDESALDQLHELQVEGEPSFVGGLISDYLVQVLELRAQIHSFQEKSDRNGLERAAHKLKSSSAVLGLTKIAAICFAIEDQARAGQPTKQHVEALESNITEAVPLLTNYLTKLN